MCTSYGTAHRPESPHIHLPKKYQTTAKTSRRSTIRTHWMSRRFIRACVAEVPLVGHARPPVAGLRMCVGIAGHLAFISPYTLENPGASKEMDMKPKFRTLVAIAVGTAILVSVSADASNRGSGITPNEAQRIAGSDGTISRAEYARLKYKQQQIRRLIQAARTN